jgi:hypothetical protein
MLDGFDREPEEAGRRDIKKVVSTTYSGNLGPRPRQVRQAKRVVACLYCLFRGGEGASAAFDSSVAGRTAELH